MAPPRAGSLIGGRYQLKSALAAGGMGTVWLASHVELETEVAIKLVSRAYAKRPDLLERFRREARAAAQLKTPHVVQILDYGVDDGAPYIAMELLDGEDLEALLDRESVVSPARALSIVQPICKALSVAHAAGIVHRDLKPSNIFISRVAGDEVVKIVDFGIAKELKRDAEYATGALVLGSPLFMSPEQVARSGAVDARTDLWSLSVLIYLLVIGEPPFNADGITELLLAVSRGEFAPPSARAAGLAPLDAFFARGLARSQHDRFADVAELAAAFGAAVAQLPDADLAFQLDARATSSVSTEISRPPEAGADSDGGVESVEARGVAPRAGIDPDATRIALVAASTQLSFSTGGSETPPASVPPPPRQTARPMKEASSRSALPIVAIAAVATAAAVAVFLLTSGDDVQATAPAARGETAHDARAPSATAMPSPPSVDPSPAPPPPSLASSSSSGLPASSAVPKASNPRGSTRPAPSAPAPASKPSGGASGSKPDTIDPEWGVPVQR